MMGTANPVRCGRRSLGLFVAAALVTSSVTQARTGTPVQSRLSVGCFPADCQGSSPLGWGATGLHSTRIELPKFDASLGTLLRVDLVLRARQHGHLRLDNTSASCATVSADLQGFPRAIASPDNHPAVTGLPPMQAVHTSPLFSAGFQLGPSDGAHDLVQARGPASDGSCVAGADHAIASFDDTSVSVFGPLTGADLAPWIGRMPEERVAFHTSYASLLGGSTPAGVEASLVQRGSLRIEVEYTYLPAEPGTVFCDCPGPSACGNPAAPGEGCANSTGRGARLRAVGIPRVQGGDLALHAEQLPPGATGLFVEGDLRPSTPALLGDGLLCVAGSLRRVTVTRADEMGHASVTHEDLRPPTLSASARRQYQLWYRDPSGSPCGTGRSGTNGLEVEWQP